MTEWAGYTQREWDRVVGWGKVPEEYKRRESNADANEKEKELSEHITIKAES